MNYNLVGHIIGTHGIKGEVKVKSETSFQDERYKKGNILYLDFQNQMIEITIDSHRFHKDFDLISFNNITNINDVLKYVGCNIYVNSESLSELAENEYYYNQLIGLEAFDEGGKKLGIIEDIEEVPQGILLVLKKPDQTESLIPFVGEFIKEINLDKKRIVIAVIEGLL